MARTFHHRKTAYNRPYHTMWGDPAWYRRQHSRLHRARCNHLIRIGRYDDVPPLRKKWGYYW